MVLNNKRRINFSKEHEEYILNSRRNNVSRRKIIFELNKKFGYKINITSTGVIDRVVKENLE